jgi:hypothetical protein
MMSRQEAQAAGIEEHERPFYFRTDRGKANYLPAAGGATWRRFVNVRLLNEDEVGVVVPWTFPGRDGAPSSPEMQRANDRADELFMLLLARLTLEGREVNDRNRSKGAPLIFSKEPEAKEARIGKAGLEGAMRRLLRGGRIRLETRGDSGHEGTRIVAT